MPGDPKTYGRPIKSVRLYVVGSGVVCVGQAAAEACFTPPLRSGDRISADAADVLLHADDIADAAVDWLAGVVASHREARA